MNETSAAKTTNPDIELPKPQGEVVVHQSNENAVVAHGDDAMVGVIERALHDPSIDIEKLERLTALYERLQAGAAKRAYISALRIVQGKLPTINRKGRIEIKEKGTDNIIQSTAYAKWEDIHDAILPVLAEGGFMLSFRVGAAQDGRITVTAVLSHDMGHQEETMMTLPFDSTGSKNNVQAIGSSASYGKRYTAQALLNLNSRGEDDDGKAAGGTPEIINQKQVASIQKKIVEAGADIKLFCEYLGVDKIEEIPMKQYKKATIALDLKIKQAKEQEKGGKKK